MPALYDRIASLCDKNRTTVTAVCSAMQISRASMTDYKNGRSHSLSTETVAKIAEYFHVSMEYLLTGELCAGGKIPLYRSSEALLAGVSDEQLLWNCSDPESCFACVLRPEDIEMKPRLLPGDIIILRKALPETIRICTGQGVLVSLPDGRIRIGSALSVPDGLVLSAQNPDCPPCWYPLPAEENRNQKAISVLGVLIGMAARFGT